MNRNKFISEQKIKEKERMYVEIQEKLEKQNMNLNVEIKKLEKQINSMYLEASRNYKNMESDDQFQSDKKRVQNYDSKLKGIFEHLMMSVIVTIEGGSNS
jgi:hypothetical protein